MKKYLPCAFVSLLLLCAVAADAASGNWNTADGGGDWSNAASWLGGDIAGGSGSQAAFQGGGGTARLTAPVTIGHLVLSGSSQWKIDNGGDYRNSLTLEGTGGELPSITTGSGTGWIAAALNGTQGFVKQGSGVLYLGYTNWYSGQTIIDQGVIAIRANANGAGTDSALGKSGVGNETVIRGTGNTSDTRGSLRFDDANNRITNDDIIFRLDNTTTNRFTSLIDKRTAATATLGGSLTVERTGAHNGSTYYGISVAAGTLNQNGAVSGALGTGSQAAGQGEGSYLLLDVSTAATANINGAISDGSIGEAGLGLRKEGDGTLNLTAQNTYTGNTEVAGGGLNLAETASLFFDLQKGNRVIGEGTGSVRFDGFFNVATGDDVLTDDTAWQILDGTFASVVYGDAFFLSLSGATAGAGIVLNADNQFTFSNQYGTWLYDAAGAGGVLSFTAAVPEPGTVAALLGAVAGACAFARRRRCRASHVRRSTGV